ncbi:hypothetical protein BI49514_03085 [Brevibacterium iodinum ATCC 49514]|uniref:Uncharacterized protein n=1 Tax=Brevibacterium iodinum ATCC 49514 TaxID=1255616 RepID=A0A2H1KIM4_9MICO|nr:hypothetical protein BI49514_03085 [Brevibacterium iodinum ATCC 49514]SUW14360.1 Uncharacterised protein [Brevibacterium iodinum]
MVSAGTRSEYRDGARAGVSNRARHRIMGPPAGAVRRLSRSPGARRGGRDAVPPEREPQPARESEDARPRRRRLSRLLFPRPSAVAVAQSRRPRSHVRMRSDIRARHSAQSSGITHRWSRILPLAMPASLTRIGFSYRWQTTPYLQRQTTPVQRGDMSLKVRGATAGANCDCRRGAPLAVRDARSAARSGGSAITFRAAP